MSSPPRFPVALHTSPSHEVLLRGLEDGSIRAAHPTESGEWHVDRQVKQAILQAFRVSETEDLGSGFFDRTAFPPRRIRSADEIRLVPGGSSIRRGAHLGKGVVVMPPAYVNVGAYVGADAMIDSHALVGSCAQVGARVHLSAGAQIGGVLEPAGARPVIVEDDVFVGALSGLFEGVLIRRRAVIAAGVVLTGSTLVHDLVRQETIRGEIPIDAVVIPGSRPVQGEWGRARGLSLQAPMIVKYRDERTDAATLLEEALR